MAYAVVRRMEPTTRPAGLEVAPALQHVIAAALGEPSPRMIDRLRIHKGALIAWLAAAAGIAILVWSLLLAPQTKPGAAIKARALTPASSSDYGNRALKRRTETARLGATNAQETSTAQRALASLLLLGGTARHWNAR
jgi:hypothetical protein